MLKNIINNYIKDYSELNEDEKFFKSMKFFLYTGLVLFSLFLLSPIYRTLVVLQHGTVDTVTIDKMTSLVTAVEGSAAKQCATVLREYSKPVIDCYFQEGINEGDIVKIFIADNNPDYALKYTNNRTFWAILKANTSYFNIIIAYLYLIAFCIKYIRSIFLRIKNLISSIKELKPSFDSIFGNFFKNIYSLLLFISGLFLAYFLYSNLTDFLVDNFINMSFFNNLIVYLSFIILSLYYPYIFHKTVDYIVFSDSKIFEKIAKTGALFVLVNLLIALIVMCFNDRNVNVFDIIIKFYKGILGF